MKNVYTTEQWAAVEADLANGMTVKEAGERNGVKLGTVRSHMYYKKSKEKSTWRECPQCGTVIDSPKMKFCWNCGYDVRLEEILLIEDTKELRKILSILPSSQSDKGIQIALKIEDYIKRAAKEKGCL